VPGFVANRLQEALWREALHMVANGGVEHGLHPDLHPDRPLRLEHRALGHLQLEQPQEAGVRLGEVGLAADGRSKASSTLWRSASPSRAALPGKW
jgi:hypothetical protein